MTQIRKDFWIELLKYADKEKRFTVSKAVNDLKLSSIEKRQLDDAITIFDVFRPTGQKYGGGNVPIEDYLTLSIEGIFKLIDYTELAEARKNSREAKWLAIIAIIISLGIGFFSTTKIDSKQFTKIEQIQIDLNELKKASIHQNTD